MLKVLPWGFVGRDCLDTDGLYDVIGYFITNALGIGYEIPSGSDDIKSFSCGVLSFIVY